MWWGQNQSYKEVELDEFKDILGLGLKYKQIGELNRYVVAPALEQINTKTDFNLEISMRKIGRSFTHIQLRFNRKEEATAEDLKRKQNKQEAAKRLASPKSAKRSNPLKGVTDLEAFYKKHRLGVESMDETFKRLRKEADEGTFSMTLTD
jgi:plasmid replication initiation protein